jgi:hypothetical protein
MSLSYIAWCIARRPFVFVEHSQHVVLVGRYYEILAVRQPDELTRHLKLHLYCRRVALNNEMAIAALANGITLMEAALPRLELASLLIVSSIMRKATEGQHHYILLPRSWESDTN